MPAKGKGNGKKKGKGHSNKTKSSNRALDPTSNCIFPREIVRNILSRLPVKSLLRFRCVCKPWLKLISKPTFIATHMNHHSSSLKQHNALLLHTRHIETDDHVLSLYSPPEPSVVELDNPFSWAFRNMVVVGSCNGIVCLCLPPLGDVITLWNPAMRQSRRLQESGKKPLMEVHTSVSMGLAYDSRDDDFLILRLLRFRQGPTFTPDEVEVCSTKAFTWKRLKNEPGFHVQVVNCNVIVKGVPYWHAVIEDEHGFRDVLVCFDVDRKAFDKLPMPGMALGSVGRLVDLNDSVGMLVWDETDISNLDVWVMNYENGWTKKYNVGPLFGFDDIRGYSKNGDIVAENKNGVLVLFDPVTISVKAELCVDNAKHGKKFVLNYSESLVLITGMMPVEKESAEVKLIRGNLIKAGFPLKVQ